jgi:hypothetical protein
VVALPLKNGVVGEGFEELEVLGGEGGDEKDRNKK